MKKRRIRKEILVIILFIQFCLLGLIASIDNNILSVCYGLTLGLLIYKIGKREGLI